MSQVFELIKSDANSRARRGRVFTKHGKIETPIFMPVGTQATVKSVTPAQLKDIGSQIILGNTYHLNIRPTSELIQRLGGLHKFMSWDGPILTDSGGFQVFSLSALRKVTDEGISFKSHLDGRQLFLGPKEVMNIQMNLGSDIAMVIDECPPWPAKKEAVSQAVKKSIKWAGQCLDISRDAGFLDRGHHVFGIVQGSGYEDLRRECAIALRELDFPGYAIGGVSVGEPEEEMLKAVDWSTAELPKEKPRYVMGVGTPPQLLRMVALGADMFDCVMPTREARHGSAFTIHGKINMKNARFKEDLRPIDESVQNYSSNFSRAYIRHLYVAQEILACTLLSIHNLHFFLDLMRQAREHLEAGDFMQWSTAWIERYEAGSID